MSIRRSGNRAFYEPSPAEIRAACQKIQSEWNRVQERNRNCYRKDGVSVPRVKSEIREGCGDIAMIGDD